MSDPITDEEFLYNYQSNRLQENSKDPYSTSIFKRRCMILSLAHSSKSLNNATACHIFEDQLRDYVELVDNRQGINNFAKATLELMSNVKNVSKSWTSGLPTDLSKVPNFWRNFEDNCSNPTNEGQCGKALPPLTVIPKLLGPANLRDGSSKVTVQTILDSFKRPIAQEHKSDRGAVKKNTLYSSYDTKQVDLQSRYSAEMSKPNHIVRSRDFGAKENRAFGNQAVQGESKFNSKTDGRGGESDHKHNFSWKSKKKGSLYTQYSDDEPEEKSGIYHQLPGGKGYYRNNKPLFSRNYGGNSNDEEPCKMEDEYKTFFKTAGQELEISNTKKFGNNGKTSRRPDNNSQPTSYEGRFNRNSSRPDYDRGYNGCERSTGFQPQAAIRKSLGGKRSVSSKFVPPVRNNSQEDDYCSKEDKPVDPESELDERLKNIEPRMIELIKSEIMDTGSKIDWDDIAGLQFAKTTIQEIVVWPMLRPDIFTGLRRPPKGILLFGPPGTGKTLIGKCIASQSNSTFFSISASSLTSKWIGDGEKMVRALFAVARCHQPAVVFIDEIDSLLSQRSDTEHESSRRIKTEFLVQLDGAGTGEDDRILVIGATNRPQELDEAARRRLVKRLYIPLPDKEARQQLVKNLMKLERNDLTLEDIEEISCLTDGYSGADMKNLCQEASLGPIRSISSKDMFQISLEQVRAVNVEDFKNALKRVKSSVSTQDLEIYLKWDQQYGSGAF